MQLRCALLFDLWFDEPLRPTRDIDLLGFGLTEAFAIDPQKQLQWQGFLKKNRLDALPLQQVVGDLRVFLLPPLTALRSDQTFAETWRGDTWRPD